ncbi:Uncharacterized conserved protein YkwD, contains CAP (CSP/antigen 5/PR1) domain [Lachnospira pectinoschiza]|uniref:Uncharacterized conserved protein YkwD, contains CAP (CSP/antigen 5/PR1) domain n=2 Tax=Lachnospira pectinoschiza TaxID=28052 RepID=A0A1G9XD60_9FIRM|nr:Uncharacterized conserved protein YkwD, contains CAP (CSP/antigen 5/PR1) domain [Lachnospira pectinoschiza]
MIMRNSRKNVKFLSIIAALLVMGTGAFIAINVAGSNNSKKSASVSVAAANTTDTSNSGSVAGESELATGTGKINVDEQETDMGYKAVVGSTGSANESTTQSQTEAPTQEETTQAATEAPTQAPTQAATQAPTQAATQAATEAPTQAPTQAATELSINAHRSDDEYHSMAATNAGVYSSYIQQVYNLINEERAAVGQAAVSFDSSLTIMACHRAVENADNNFFDYSGGHHRRPFYAADGSYKEAKTICYYYGQYGSFGEVMGRYQSTPAAIVQGWHDSQAHYNCMVSSKYTRVGVGVAQDSAGKYYWVAIFMN